jgi:hypothetical protein
MKASIRAIRNSSFLNPLESYTIILYESAESFPDYCRHRPACIRHFVELLAIFLVSGTFTGGYQDQARELHVLFSAGNLHSSEHPSFSDLLHFSEIGHD